MSAFDKLTNEIRPLLEQSMKIFVETIPQNEVIQIQEFEHTEDPETQQTFTDLHCLYMSRWEDGTFNERAWSFDVPTIFDVPSMNNDDLLEIINMSFEYLISSVPKTDGDIDIDINGNESNSLAGEFERLFNIYRNNPTINSALRTAGKEFVFEIQTVDEMAKCACEGYFDWDYSLQKDNEFFNQIELRYNKITESGYDTDKTTELY